MSLRLLPALRETLTQSELRRAAKAVRGDGGVTWTLGSAAVRRLLPEEITTLEAAGNWAEDWTRLRVVPDFDASRVRRSNFYRDVVLGRFAERIAVAGTLSLPAGVYESTVADCMLGNDVLVRNVGLLARCVVGEGACLCNNSTILCDGETTFGCGTPIPLGIETGGRDVRLHAELSVAVAAALGRGRDRGALVAAYEEALDEYLNSIRSHRSIIERGAVICDTVEVRNVYVGPGAQIRGAAEVCESALLSHPDEPVYVTSGASVRGSVLQWGSRVGSMSLVEESAITEHATVERHGKVKQSVIGPNTSVAQGEVTASLVGPFVGFHHQALLIATFWPEGKGNVSQGANVGSNHTSRAPDQELWPGEGLFVGLGVNVKFPADFTQAPYSVLACGITTLPQKVRFPFSLISAPSGHRPDVPPAYNEIQPAWMLLENLYALKRNEGKYRARDRSRRSSFTWEIFRPEIIELLRTARRRLEAVAAPQETYTERDLEGLGKNFLLESARLRAIEAYAFHTHCYALLGLKERVERALHNETPEALAGLLLRRSDEEPWEQQRRILLQDFGITNVADGLRQLPDLLERWSEDVVRSKLRDDERGRRIIDDYDEVHTPANLDPFVQQTRDETTRLAAEAVRLLARIETLPDRHREFGRHSRPEAGATRGILATDTSSRARRKAV
jgi:hypothetical protein